MLGQAANAGPLWPLALYFAAVLLVVAGMLGLSYLLGERRRDRQAAEPYECGILPTGSARLRFDVRFYLVALLFVLFDLEAVFLFAWSIAVRESGWMGYIEAAVFVGILLVALIYAWRLGVLDWGAATRAAARRAGRETGMGQA